MIFFIVSLLFCCYYSWPSDWDDKYIKYYVWSRTFQAADYSSCGTGDRGSYYGEVFYELEKCEKIYNSTDVYAKHFYTNQLSIQIYDDSICSSLVDTLTPGESCFNPVGGTGAGSDESRYQFAGLEKSKVVKIESKESDNLYKPAVILFTQQGCNGFFEEREIFLNNDYCYEAPDYADPQFDLNFKSFACDLSVKNKETRIVYDAYYSDTCEESGVGNPFNLNGGDGSCLGEFNQFFSCKKVCNGIPYDVDSVCSGNGECTDINECTCANNRLNETTFCEECNEGRANYPDCDEYVCFGETGDDVCSGHGTCSGVDECDCETDYYGEKCSHYLDWECGGILATNDNVCSGRGNCTIQGSTPLCECEEGWYGEVCEDDTWSCDGIRSDNESVCNGHGKCISVDTCNCTENYTYGDFCNTMCYTKVDNDEEVCSGHGECTNYDVCKCDENWDGYDCANTECFGFENYNPAACSRHGECVSYNTCVCEDSYAYSGDECEISSCHKFKNESACNGVGTCTDFNKCRCRGTHEGEQCQLCLNNAGCGEDEWCNRNGFVSQKNMNFECEIVDEVLREIGGNVSVFKLFNVGTNQDSGLSSRGYLASYKILADKTRNGVLECNFDDCSYEISDDKVKYECNEVECDCLPESQDVCDDSFNANLIHGITGKSYVECEDDGSCQFVQDELGFSFSMNCLGAECQEEEPPFLETTNGMVTVFVPIGVLIIFCICLTFLVCCTIIVCEKCVFKKNEKVEEEKTEEELLNDIMENTFLGSSDEEEDRHKRKKIDIELNDLNIEVKSKENPKKVVEKQQQQQTRKKPEKAVEEKEEEKEKTVLFTKKEPKKKIPPKKPSKKPVKREVLAKRTEVKKKPVEKKVVEKKPEVKGPVEKKPVVKKTEVKKPVEKKKESSSDEETSDTDDDTSDSYDDDTDETEDTDDTDDTDTSEEEEEKSE